ncbi:MAG: sigma-70 family RNA polymerase sigma factor [Myxococcota bacterium]
MERALQQEEAAAGSLVERLAPVIQVRVARALLRRQRRARSIRQEVEDMVQEIFALLFADDGRLLRSWDPEAGLGLESFVGMVAERRTASLLRSARRSPWTEDPVPAECLDRRTTPGPEPRLASRQFLTVVLERLEAQLSPTGYQVFELLFGAELSTAAIAERTELSHAAIYTWKHRIVRKAAQIARELEGPYPETGDER